MKKKSDTVELNTLMLLTLTDMTRKIQVKTNAVNQKLGYVLRHEPEYTINGITIETDKHSDTWGGLTWTEIFGGKNEPATYVLVSGFVDEEEMMVLSIGYILKSPKRITIHLSCSGDGNSGAIFRQWKCPLSQYNEKLKTALKYCAANLMKK